MIDTSVRYLAQSISVGGASTAVVITAFVTLGVVGSLWGMAKHPKMAFSSLVIIVGALYVGRGSVCWPHACGGQGLVLDIWNMWLGSLRVVWDTIWNFLGLDSFANRIGFHG